MTDREKLTALMEQFAGGSQSRFAAQIGVSRSNVATWMHRGSITANGREAILDAFPQVSREWLGGGIDSEMMDCSVASSDTIYFNRHDLVPLFEDCRASCGVVEQFEHPELAEEHIHVPGVKGKAAIPATGCSMEPTIHEGDLCIIGDEVSLGDVTARGIYLIVTRQGHCMFKRIYDEGLLSEKILALSDNPNYMPHAEPVQKDDILRLYPLRCVMHRM